MAAQSLMALLTGLLAWGQTIAQPASCQPVLLQSALEKPHLGGDRAMLSPRCMGPLRHGRAAVLLDSQDMDAPSRWGFVDGQGVLRIAPRFSAVGDFENGLAAAQIDGHWGFIGPDGQWVIQAKFDQVVSFDADGLAYVKQGAHWYAVDQQGRQVGAPLPGRLAAVARDGWNPRSLRLVPEPFALSPSGQIQRWPEGVRPVHVMGRSGLLLGAKGDDELGLVHSDGRWQDLGMRGMVVSNLAPDEFIQVRLTDAEGGIALIFPDGRVERQRYSQLIDLGGRFVAARLQDGEHYDLLHLSGRVLMKDLTGQRLEAMPALGNHVLEPKGAAVFIHSAQQSAPPRTALKFGRTSLYGPLHILHGAQDRIMGVLHDDGRPLLTNPEWRHATRLSWHERHLWMHDAQDRPVDILDERGRSMLRPADKKRLGKLYFQQSYSGDRSEDEVALLALVVPELCPCNVLQHGALLPGGQLLMNMQWQSVRLLNADGSERGMPVSNWRLAVGTDAGLFMVDGAGRTLTPHGYEAIGAMRFGHAVASRGGRFEVLGSDGRAVALPDFLEAEVVSSTLVRFRSSRDAQGRWGLYDFSRQVEVTPPTFATMTAFLNGTAEASLIEDQQGVIDEHGQWAILPRYAELGRLSPVLWSGKTGRGDGQDPTWSLIHASGRILAQDLGRAPRRLKHWVETDRLWRLDGEAIDAPAMGYSEDFGAILWVTPARQDWPTGSGADDDQMRVPAPLKAPLVQLTPYLDGISVAGLNRDLEQMVWVDDKGQRSGTVGMTDLGLLQQGLAYARKDEGYGFIDRQGEFKIPPIFDAVTPFSEGAAAGQMGDLVLLMDLEGKPLAQLVRKCGQRVLLDAAGTQQWPKTSVQCTESSTRSGES